MGIFKPDFFKELKHVKPRREQSLMFIKGVLRQGDEAIRYLVYILRLKKFDDMVQLLLKPAATYTQTGMYHMDPCRSGDIENSFIVSVTSKEIPDKIQSFLSKNKISSDPA